jgi:two-component system chemotaxis response regulator CheB
MPLQNIVVVGYSMGGANTLVQIIKELPKDWPAMMFVVQHIPPFEPHFLPGNLKKISKLNIVQARHNEAASIGNIYFAPPDYHLMLKDHKIILNKGARENHARPSIDPLFRSAAAEFGPQVIGILLSGLLFDGVAGLKAIERCGGTTLIEDPDEALYPQMLLAAKEATKIDYCLKVKDIAPLLQKLVTKESKMRKDTPKDIRTEVAIAQSIGEYKDSSQTMNEIGKQSASICPDCGGPLWEIKDDSIKRYRCYLGHAFTAEALADGQKQKLEEAFLTALRIMEERINLLKRMQKDNRNRSDSYFLRRKEDIKQLEEYTRSLRKFLER